MKIWEYSLEDLAQALRNGKITSKEATLAFLNRIEEIDKSLNSYITVTKAEALAAAEASDKRLAKGEPLSILDGVPMALEDIFCTEGILTSCGSKMLNNFLPPYNATVWERLKNAGAVLLGKCNLDEFAIGASTESSYYGAAHNPYDLSRVPGGSCGGAAAALAAGLTAYALGGDTGGSLRGPASFCGVFGFKPSYGRVSRSGVVPCASSLDQVGIFTKKLADCALIFRVIAGLDEYDSTTSPAPVEDFYATCQRPLNGLKIGLPLEYLENAEDKRIADAVYEAAQKLRGLGGEVLEISLPHTKYVLPAYFTLLAAEASTNLARYDGIAYGFKGEGEDLEETYTATRSQGFGDGVKHQIILGTYILSAGNYETHYKKALEARTLIKEDFIKAFQNVDCLLTPVNPSIAYKIGEKAADSLSMAIGDIYTASANLAGLPAISVPYCMLDKMPLGLQIIAPAFGEDKLFQAANALTSIAQPVPAPDLPGQNPLKEVK